MKRLLLPALIVVVLMAVAIIILQRYGAFFKPAPKALQKAEIVKDFPFNEENALKEWEEKIFRGKVVYRVEKGQTLSYVRATSDKTASALYYKLKLDAKKKDPVISWKWNVDRFPQKKTLESLETENEDDFAARVYVIFPAMFFTNSKVLEYIWSETLPEGMIGTSPYSKNIKLIVARSGPNLDKKWFQEDRDITADYMKAFGTKPEYNIGAVAFMTNTEHTGTSADAMYDEIKLGYKETK
jgi:hypothetical protein